MSVPAITAVIPTYRRPRLLRRAIESVLAQTDARLRVLVSDNASGDETPALVREIAARDPRVLYHVQPRNLGAVGNFRWAIAAVDTPWFSILSDDDVLLPDFYALAAERLAAAPEARMFCGRTVLYDEGTGSHSVTPGGDWREGTYAAGAATARMLEYHFTWTGCVIASSLREGIGPLSEVAAGDVLYTAVASALAPMVVSLAPCAVFTVTSSNYSGLAPLSEFVRGKEVLRDRCLRLPNVPPEDQDRIASILAGNLRVRASGIFRDAFVRGDWDRFEEAAAFLRDHGALSASKRIRVAAARRRDPRSPLLRAVRAWTAAALRRRQRAGGQGLRLEEVAARYAAELAATRRSPGPTSGGRG